MAEKDGTRVRTAAPRPTVVLLHALGGSARSWDGVVAALGDHVAAVALDLPGFGAASRSARLTVEEMLDELTGQVRDLVDGPWLLVGHSMGGKLATLLAARAEAGEHGLVAPDGVVLVAASPPAPEPMTEPRRAEMLGWWEGGAISRADAARYVEANSAGRLGRGARSALIEDVLASSRTAWIEWLTRGSLEDWSHDVGALRTPAVLLAGAEDEALGADEQRRLNLPHYPGAAVQVVAGAAHLVPEEQPDAVAAAILRHLDAVAGAAPPP